MTKSTTNRTSTTQAPTAGKPSEPTPCPLTWCAMDDTSDGHDNFHSGHVQQLTGAAGDGWHAWAVQDAREEVLIHLEGDRPGGETLAAYADAEGLAMVLAATATAEGRQRLVDLLEAVGVRVPR